MPQPARSRGVTKVTLWDPRIRLIIGMIEMVLRCDWIYRLLYRSLCVDCVSGKVFGGVYVFLLPL